MLADMLGLDADAWQAAGSVAAVLVAAIALVFAAMSAVASQRSARAAEDAAAAALAQVAPVIVGEYVRPHKGRWLLAKIKNAGNGPGEIRSAELSSGRQSLGVGAIQQPTLASGWHTEILFEALPPPNRVPLHLLLESRPAAGSGSWHRTEITFEWIDVDEGWRVVSSEVTAES